MSTVAELRDEWRRRLVACVRVKTSVLTFIVTANYDVASQQFVIVVVFY